MIQRAGRDRAPLRGAAPDRRINPELEENVADNSIINLGELSKPATVLIEKISDAVGGIFKPYQIIRAAKAEFVLFHFISTNNIILR